MSEKNQGDPSVEKLCELFSKLLEQQQLKTAPEIMKHVLEPNPVKLSGPENYISWARHARLILSSHDYERLLTDGEGAATGAKQTNDKVLVWLLGSMELTVREQVETMATVAEVWAALESQFSGKSNKMQATRITHELTHLKQGSMSVTEYANRVRRLYRDLHYYHPFEPVDKKDMSVHHSWFQSFVSKLFLDGLNQKFDLRRQLIFSEFEWPSLDDIVSSITEEETRLANPEMNIQREPDARAALSIQNGNTSVFPRNQGKKNYLFCDKCKREGHTIERCFKIHGYPPGWKRGRSQPGGAQGDKKKQAHHTKPEGELLAVDVQALEEYKSKLKLSDGMSSTQGSSTADFSFHAMSQGAKDRENSWDWDCA